MTPQTETTPHNELTLMFFFAADNTLAPSMISQLKAIKDAGFQENTTVVVRYDPNEKGAATRIFEVNSQRKKEFKAEGKVATEIGDGKDPFVRNMKDDEVPRKRPETGRGGPRPLAAAKPLDADQALAEFLELCREKYRAKHYMLFLIGHGMIVANDAFLPDESPKTAITMKQLGDILRGFAGRVEQVGDSFDLVGMHSCSMSAVELAYELKGAEKGTADELKGTPKYMMASEGISFVGTWPYRQLLKKVFNTVDSASGNTLDEKEQGKPEEQREQLELKRLLMKLHFLCLHNSTDFMFSGHSADLSLCNLKNVRSLDVPLASLTKVLKRALEVECGRELILLAHWKSQSYWQENYTDLYDFCRCLHEKCSTEPETNRAGLKTSGVAKPLCRCAENDCDKDGTLRRDVVAACEAVMTAIDPPQERIAGSADSDEMLRPTFEKLVVFSDHFGPTYQYSHGLSIYFPWSRPLDDGIDDGGGEDGNGVLKKYKDYAFTTALGDDAWLNFLELYFKKTMRKRRSVEDGAPDTRPSETQAIGTVSAGSTAPGDSLPIGGGGKPDPALFGGAGCACPSIKNYPLDFEEKSQGARDAYRKRSERQSS